MAADANLIRGARDAASGASKMTMAGGELGKTAQSLIGRVDARTAELKLKTEQAKERERELGDEADKMVEDAAAKAGSLGQAEYDLTRKKVDAWRLELDECVLGDDACRRKVMSKMSQESQGLVMEKEGRKDNLELYKTLSNGTSTNDKTVMGQYSKGSGYTVSMERKTKDKDGNLISVKNQEEQKIYTFQMPEGSVNAKGEPITERKMTEQEVQKLFDQQKDLTSAETTSQMAIDSNEKGLNGEEFNKFQVRSTYEKIMNDSNSYFSAINDDWGVGDFSSSIDKKIASELGGLKNLAIIAEQGETNWYDKISKEDEEEIKRRLMNPETDEEKAISKEMVIDYYVDAQEQQYNNGVKQRQAAIDAAEQERQDKIIKEARDRQLKRDLAEGKGPTLTAGQQKEQALVGTIANIIQVDSNDPMAYAALDGTAFVNDTPGEPGAYVRQVDGKWILYKGDPDTVVDGASMGVALETLSDDANQRGFQLVNHFGASNQFISPGGFVRYNYEKETAKLKEAEAASFKKRVEEGTLTDEEKKEKEKSLAEIQKRMKEAFADDTEDSAKYMEQAKYDMDEWNKKYTK
mgnify:FL=1|tara:strand:+ start:1235 stop:2971 length:1737 start_codon:yes stop_codon:yes gene_type:complete